MVAHRLVSLGSSVCVALLAVVYAVLLWAFGGRRGTTALGVPLVALDAKTTHAMVGWGACNKHTHDQAYWGTVEGALSFNGTRAAEGFAWLGDVIYADDLVVVDGRPTWVAAPVAAMRAKYAAFRGSAGYSRFRAGLLSEPTGVWDDHDMGLNDAGRDFPHKRAAQDIYLDFLGVPAASPRRRREGVYSLHATPFRNLSAAPARRFDFAVCLVMLDARYHRETSGAATADLLGHEQWTWLDAILADPSAEIGASRVGGAARDLFSRCAVTAFGSGVQVLSDEKPTEHWGLYPASRDRLLRTLAGHGAARFVLLSGDVHYADLLEAAHPTLGRVVEVTSSGLTHSLADVGMTSETFDILNWSPRRRARFIGRSFGSIRVSDTEAVISVHDVATGTPVLQHRVPFAPPHHPATAPSGLPTMAPNHHHTGYDLEVHTAPAKRLFLLMDALPFAVALRTRHRIVDALAAARRLQLSIVDAVVNRRAWL